MRRGALLAGAAALAILFWYLSRFWVLDLWSRPGLFGWEHLPPQGGLVARWLRGTDAAPFELLIWAIGCFLVLTLVQNLYDRATRPKDADQSDTE